MEPVRIVEAGLLLRCWRGADTEAVYHACQDPLIQRWTLVPVPYRREDAEAFVHEIAPAALAADTGLHLGVFDAETEELLGACGFVNINLAAGSAEIGYWTAPRARGQRVAVRACRALTRWGIDTLGLRRIQWCALVGNHASRLVALRAGFRMDGVIRAGLRLRDGTWTDGWFGSLLPSDLESSGGGEPIGGGARVTDEPADLLRSPGLIIDAGGVRLRPYQPADADDVAVGCADPLTQRFLPALPCPYTRDDALWWITEGGRAAWAGGGAAYAIADPVTDRVLGGAGLGRVSDERAQAEIGYWVAPWARGKGVATAAASALTGWAFARGFARVELLTAWANEASQRVAIAAGFRYEGVRRQALARRDGVRYDVLAWVRLADDPPPPAPRLLPDLPVTGLTDGVVTLRPVREDDGDFLHALHTVPDVVASAVPRVAPDRADTDRRVTRAIARWLIGERADLVIVDAASGQAAGEIGLYYEEPVTGQAMIGYCLLPEWRGHGLAARAARLVADWAFTEAGIARLVAGTSPGNLGSRRVLERAGFRREGYLRGRLPGPDGDRTDDLLYARLPGDPPGDK